MSNFYYTADIEEEVLEPNKVSRKILARGGSMMLVQVSFQNGGVGEVHTHVHEQSSYVAEGEFEFVIGDETKKISKGDTIYMPSNVAHGCRVLSEKGVLIDIFTPQREDFLK